MLDPLLVHQNRVLFRLIGCVFLLQLFEWPIGRPIEPEETVSVALVLHSRLLPDRSIGHFILGLETALKDGKLALRDSLLDNNGRPLPVSLFFFARFVLQTFCFRRTR
jgi:hypothetical protein